MQNEEVAQAPQTSAVTVAPETKTEAEGTEKKLNTLSAVEKVVNEYALTLARKHKRHDVLLHAQRGEVTSVYFQVHLVRKLRGIMAINGGATVHIFLLWPDAQPNINTLLKEAFAAIVKYNLRRTMEIVPYAMVRETKRWARAKFTDESGIIMELLDEHRIEIDVSMTVTMRDKVTKETLSRTLTGTQVYTRHDPLHVPMRIQLSRIVRDKFPEEELPDDVEPTTTPELDSAIAQLQTGQVESMEFDEADVGNVRKDVA